MAIPAGATCPLCVARKVSGFWRDGREHVHDRGDIKMAKVALKIAWSYLDLLGRRVKMGRRAG